MLSQIYVSGLTQHDYITKQDKERNQQNKIKINKM